MSEPAVPPRSPVREILRSLAAGFVWLGILFGTDLWDSWWQLERSAKRVQTDETAIATAREAIKEYLVGVVEAHVLLALMAGVLLHLVVGMWLPRPAGNRQWWGTALGFGILGTVAFYSYDMALFPQRHPWFPWISFYADHSQPPVVLGIWTLVALGLLVAAAWKNRGPDLMPFARRLALLSLVLGGWTWATRSPPPPASADNAGPNVVIIGVDGLRPDHLRSFGYDKDTAPHIEALLSESVVFEQSWTVFARTYPSWMSILSGLLPVHHGIRDNLPQADELVPAGAALLPQLLSEQGYHTRFITDDSRFSYMVPATGFQEIDQPGVGIQNFAISANEPYFRLVGGLFYNRVGFSMVPLMAHNQAHGRTFRPNAFVKQSSDLLRRSTQHDKFLYTIHTCVLHAPGDRPWPWHQMNEQKGYEGPNRFKYNRAGTTLAPTDDEEGLDEEAVAQQDERLYDSGLDMADRLVAALMDDLESAGLLDNTIVVLLSDHGEESWEPDLPYRYFGPNHGYHPYGDAQHRTLLAIRFPDGRAAGTRVPDTVRTIDIAPTLAELLGLSIPNAIDGQSMVALIDGARETEPRPVFIETGMTESRYWGHGHRSYPWKGVSARYRVDADTGHVHVRPEFKPHLLAAKDRVYQEGIWKLVWRPAQTGLARVELYDRSTDPINRHDLARENPERVAALGMKLAPLLALDGIGEPRLPIWAAQLGLSPDPELLRLSEEAAGAIQVAPSSDSTASGPAHPELLMGPWARPDLLPQPPVKDSEPN